MMILIMRTKKLMVNIFITIFAQLCHFYQLLSAFFKHFTEDKLQSMVDLCTAFSDHPGSALGPYHRDRLRCFAYIAPSSSSWRVNTLLSFCEANKQILHTENWNQINQGHPIVRVDPTCTSKTKKVGIMEIFGLRL
jgi:hypothetical protein